MTGFSIDWLNLREAADRRSRDSDLLLRAQQWLCAKSQSSANSIIVDMGAGTGSTVRAFSDFSGSNPDSLSWRLVDNDAALLEEAILRHKGKQQLETYELDLNAVSALPLGDLSLLTCSALIDLVSAEFMDRLVERLQQLSRQSSFAVYSALNYDGSTEWAPRHAMDETVLSAFNRDQQRDKGFGVALGPSAVQYLQQALSDAGFTVSTASSPWELGGTDSELVHELISGISDAVAKDPTLDNASIQEWLRFRKENVATGTCKIGHKDLLAIPQN